MNNVELKVGCNDLEAVRSRAINVGASDHGCFDQSDTFFEASSGRLKLRRESTGAVLISYHRADEAALRVSAYDLVELPDADAMEQVLARVLPIRTVVRKRRCLLILNNTRIHLDSVEQLGDFVELETVVNNQSIEEANREAASVMGLLGLGELPPLAQAYADLLEASLEMRKRGDVWTEAEAEALREMASLGISKSEAARRLGRHSSTISVRSRRADLRWTSPPKQIREAKPPPLGPLARPWTKEDDRRLSKFAAEGVPIGLAANEMDRTYNTVLNHAKRLELKFERDRQAHRRHKMERGG